MVERRRVVSNPLLQLVTRPRRERVTGGSKDPKKIKPDLYTRREKSLADAIKALKKSSALARATHGGHVLLWASMAPDSLAATHTPSDLFDEGVDARLVSAWRMGYVVDITVSALDKLLRRVQNPTNNLQRCDIFRIENLELFAAVLLRTVNIDRDWSKAEDSGTGIRGFITALPAFIDRNAHASVISAIQSVLSADRGVLIASQQQLIESGDNDQADVFLPETTWLAEADARQALQAILAHWPRRLVLGLSSASLLPRLIESGSIVRWEPVQTLRPTLPGAGPEPDPVLPALSQEPIVGIIDGGYHASRYKDVVAWRQTPPLVPR
jgi:hypothetical protein